MRRAFVLADRFISLPRGWTILALASVAWMLVFAVVQLASSLFSFVAASF